MPWNARGQLRSPLRKTAPACSRSHVSPNTPGAVTGAGVQCYALLRVFDEAVGSPGLQLQYAGVFVNSVLATGGERPWPNGVTVRASVLYPAGVWRQVNGSAAWSSTATYTNGNMVAHNGGTWICTSTSTSGTAPADGSTLWRRCVRYPVTFPNQDATTRRTPMAPNEVIRSEPITIPDVGGTYAPWIGVTTEITTGASNAQWMASGGAVIGDFAVHHASTVPAPGAALDMVDNGVSTQTTSVTEGGPTTVGGAIVVPSLVVSQQPRRTLTPPTPVIGVVGHSISLGEGDGLFQDAINEPGRTGYIGRLFARERLLMLGCGGHRASQMFAAVAPHRHALLAELCDWAWCEIGAGDMIQGDRTFAQIQADLITLWEQLRKLGLQVAQTTVTPYTTSTTSDWTTLTAQTGWGSTSYGGSGSIQDQVNRWLRDGAPYSPGNSGIVRAGTRAHPVARIVDTAVAVTDPTGKWEASTPALTTDGAHPTATGYRRLAATAAWCRLGMLGQEPQVEHPHGLLAWTVPPLDVTSTITPASGVATVAKLMRPWPGGVLSSVISRVTTAGSVTSNQVWIGIYTPDGTLIGFANLAPGTVTEIPAGVRRDLLNNPQWVPPMDLLVALAVGTAVTRPAFSAATATSTANANFALPATAPRRWSTSVAAGSPPATIAVPTTPSGVSVWPQIGLA